DRLRGVDSGQFRYHELARTNRWRSKIPGESANRQSTKRLHSWLNRAVFPRQAPFAWGAGILFGGKLPQFSLRPAKLWLFTGTAQTDLLVDLRRPWLQLAELRDLQR